jgi:hypothetical protein
VRELDQMALGTFDHRERAMEFRPCRVLFAGEIIRKRLGPEIEERFPERRVAVAAGVSSVLIGVHKLLCDNHKTVTAVIASRTDGEAISF